MGRPTAPPPSLKPEEWRLLACTLPDGYDEAAPSGDDLVELVVEGRYAAALTQAVSLGVLPPAEGCASLREWSTAARSHIKQLYGDMSKNGLLLLTSGVAALMSFCQASLTGPASSESPALTATLPSLVDWDPPANNEEPWSGDRDPWVLREAQVDGEDLVCGRIDALDMLVLASMLLWEPLADAEPPAALPSWAWWAARVLGVHQRALGARSMTLRGGLVRLTDAVLTQFHPDADAAPDTRLAAVAASSARLEAALCDFAYGRDETARAHLDAAGAALGFKFRLTGRLAKKTMYQQDAATVLVVETEAVDASAAGRGRTIADLGAGEGVAAAAAAADLTRATHGLTGETEVFQLPHLLSTAGAVLGNAGLGAAEQAVLLGWSVNVKLGQAEEDMNLAQMGAFVEAVMAQPRSEFMVRAMAELQMCRKEAARSRTMERGLLEMEALVMRVRQSSGVSPRVRALGALSASAPLLPMLMKEWALVQMRFGMVGQAMEVFERQEMWEQLCACYVMLEKKHAAEAIVRKRLETAPEDPRMLTVLGDLTQDPACWEKAWEASGGRYVRAQRRLAERAHRLGDWEASAAHWELALKTNALHPEGWFSLGHCHIKLKSYDRAIEAFTRCGQLAPEHGEAFNNLAALLLERNRPKEAYTALSEAGRLLERNWQVQENLARAAIRSEHWLPAANALCKVTALTHGERCEVELLSSLVRHLRDLNHQIAADAAAGDTSPDAVGRARLKTHLAAAVGTVVRAVVQSSAASPDVWACAAVYWEAVGELKSAKECHLKRVRGLQGRAWKKETGAFEAFAEASIAMCEGQLAAAAADRAVAKRELSAARMHLQSVLKQAEGVFGEHAMFGEMQAVLERVLAAEEELQTA
ncbi:unnamed protein product [Pedinophyceae sp. YPF-701]|nr:unnamed protein product [Pedinophyceae sp. YPF-701]